VLAPDQHGVQQCRAPAEDERDLRVGQHEDEAGEPGDRRALPRREGAVRSDPDRHRDRQTRQRVGLVEQPGATPETVSHRLRRRVVRDRVYRVEHAAGTGQQQGRDRHQQRRHDAHTQAAAAPLCRGALSRGEHGQRREREDPRVGQPLRTHVEVPDQRRADDAQQPVRDAQPGAAQPGQGPEPGQPRPAPHGEDDALDGQHEPDDDRMVRIRPSEYPGGGEEAADHRTAQGAAGQRRRQAGHRDRDGGGDQRLARLGKAFGAQVLGDRRGCRHDATDRGRDRVPADRERRS